jgi:hypothetical protein
VINRFVANAAWLLWACLPLQVLAVSPPCSTISVAPATTLPNGTAGVSYGPTTFTASGSAATPYTYDISSGLPSGSGLSIGPANGSLSGTPTQAGSFIMTVTATDTNGCTGGRTYQLDVGVGNQTINFTSTAPSSATVSGPTYNVTATATSGLPVAFTIDATAAGVCSIAGSTVSFNAIGTCVIDASQAGNASFNAAAQVQQSFAVGMGSQAITFTSTPPASPTVGGPTYNVTATGGGSGNPVTFTIDATATTVCSIVGSTVSFLTTGTCVIDADQAGDANYNAAPQAVQSFGVGKSNQTITFTSTAPASAAVGGATYIPTATASSGLTVAFTIDASAAAICSISAGTVSFTAAGTCVIDANQAGDSNYNPAPQVQQSFVVGKGDQTISFTSIAPASATVGGPTYNVTATATSGLPVTFTIDAAAASICSIAGSTVSFIAVGSCVIDANQAGNANYNAAPQVLQSFAVGQGSQTISFTSTAPVSAAVGGPTYNVTATATSGLAVTLTIDATASTVCSIAGSTVSFIGSGTCLIDANQAGNANYTAATQAQQSFGVGLGNQTITFTSTAPVGAKVGGPTYNVTATGGASGNPVVFSIDATAASICSIAGNTVSFIAVGNCVVDADQAGNANYNAALTAQQSFGVAKGDQTIAFSSAAPAATVGGPTYNVTATATSGLTVTFTIDAAATSVCSINNVTNTVSFTAVGTCIIDADQAGDTNWNPATQTQQSFAVGQGSQTISFTSTTPATAKVGGATYNVTATATSGLAVTFTIDPSATSICSIAGNVVSFTAVGTCKIDANQGGNADYTAAPQAQQTFSVAKGDQTINFTSTPPPGVKVNDAAYTVTATSSAGLTVTFTIDAAATSVCSIAGSAVSFNAGGTCIIDANQAGNANYNAATQAQQSFVVAKLDQTITFTSTAPAAAKVGGATYNVTATSSSGLTVTFSAGSTACNVAGSTVSFVHATTCIVNADQAGNAQYNAAPQVQQSFAVAKGDQTINISTTAPLFGSASASATPHTYTIAATATSTLTVTFTTAGACTNATTLVTFGPGAGVCTINADQAGNADWNPAPQVQQSTTVEIPATAVGDSHNVTGNVAIAAGTSVMNNDSGTAIAIKSYGATTGGEQTSIGTATATAQGGSVTLIAAGTYNYDPPANFTGTDTFKYIIGNDLVATSTGTVTLTVADRIIVVASGASGNCKAATPCLLSVADALAAPTGKDLVFVKSGAFAAPNATITLNSGQVLTGNFVSLTQAISDATITLAAESVAPVVAASTTPTLTNAGSVITIAGGNLVEYFSITNSAGSAILGNAAGAGTSTIHDIAVTDGAVAGNGVNITANVGTLNFSNLVVTTSSGGAFAATGGGTVNVTTGSTPSTLASTTGTALNVSNTTIGASNLNFKSISANGCTNGIILNTTGAGGLIVTGVGTTPGSGGTIQNCSAKGADLRTASNISLKNMNFSGNGTGNLTASTTCGDALNGTNGPTNCNSNISLKSVATATLDNVAVTGSKQIGIDVNGGSNFTLTNLTVTGNGNETLEDGVQIVDLTGTLTVSGGIFRDNAANQFEVQNGVAATLNVAVDSATFSNTNFPTGATTPSNVTANSGLFLATHGASSSTIINPTVTNSTFDRIYAQAFRADLAGATTMTINFGPNSGAGNGNTLTNDNQGVSITGANSGGLTYSVRNNNFQVNPGVMAGGATNQLGVAKSNPAGNWNGTIANNIIGTAGATNSGCVVVGCNGIDIGNNNSGGLHKLSITGNQVHNVEGSGIAILSGGGSDNSNASWTVQNNMIGNPDQNAGAANPGIIMQSGSSTGTDTTDTCADISGNTISGTWSLGTGHLSSIRVRSLSTAAAGSFSLVGFNAATEYANDPTGVAGSTTGAAGTIGNVADYVRSLNPAVSNASPGQNAASASQLASAAAFTGAVACP